jgi:hypothetical protein
MIHMGQFTEALVGVLRSIPELVADLALADPESIIPYLEIAPEQASVDSTSYRQAPGTLLVVERECNLEVTEGGIAQYAHYTEILVRAQRGQSPYDLIDDIFHGVPQPGDTQRWHYCPIMPGVQRTEFSGAARQTDSEGIDVWIIKLKTFEQGDP